MRISDWSSDVCSSDLARAASRLRFQRVRWPPSLVLFSPGEVSIESVERGRSARDPLLVVVGAGTDAGDKRAHSRSFRALEPSIGNIKDVNNFAERPQRGVGLETGEEHKGLEGAAVASVGELRVRHVEPPFARTRHLSSSPTELETPPGR